MWRTYIHISVLKTLLIKLYPCGQLLGSPKANQDLFLQKKISIGITRWANAGWLQNIKDKIPCRRKQDCHTPELSLFSRVWLLTTRGLPPGLFCPWALPARMLERVPISYPRRSSRHRAGTHAPRVPCISRWSLYPRATWLWALSFYLLINT